MSVAAPSAVRSRPGAIRFVILLSAVVAVALAGCGAPPGRAVAPLPPPVAEPPPAAARPVADPTSADPVDWSGPVPVARLVAAARAFGPDRSAMDAARSAAGAQVRGAGTWANPELELTYGRTRPRQPTVERDTPYGGSLRQRLTWWGTRNARVEAAEARLGTVEAEGRIAQLVLHAEVRRAAIAYASASEAATQAEADARLARELADQSGIRLTAGDADRATAARAELEAVTATLQRDTSRREVVTALAVLRTWCGPDLPEGLVIADALAPAALPGSAQAVSTQAVSTQAVAVRSAPPSADRHPRLMALVQAQATANSTVAAERQARLPDVTIGVFADREAEKDTYGASVGLAIPLWDRNEAGIAQAEAESLQAQANARRERLRLERDLAEAVGAIEAAEAEVAALTAHAIPAADEAVRLRTTAYRSGDASLSDLLEARRIANAVRTGLRDARRRAALAAVDLGLALGDPGIGPETANP